MSLALKVSQATVANCSTLTITDTTGSYDVSTNPGGYGAPNTARNALGLLMIVTNKMTTGDVAATVDNGDALTVSSWTVDFTLDGWYEYYMAAAPVWSSGTTYAIDYISYDASTNAFYKSLQAGNLNHEVTDTAWWIPTTLIDDFLAAANVINGLYDDLVTCKSENCASTANANIDCGCSSEDMKKYNQIVVQLDGANYSYGAQDYYNAQKKIETIQGICSDLNCLDC